MQFKAYSEMTDAEKAAIDADEDRREAYKASMSREDEVSDLRHVYASYREDARKYAHFKGNFRQECVRVNGGQVPATPAQWVEAARLALDSLMESHFLAMEIEQG